jgi:PEP-CTERM/exosortase A-associated glycosyltransferase
MVSNKSLKILHILDHSLPFQSGYAFRTSNILRAQQKRGWQPVALTAPEHNKITSANANGTQHESIGGVLYYRTRAVRPADRQLITAYRTAAALTRRIREVIGIEKPDLLHVHSPVFNALPTLWINRKTGLPLVYEIHAFWEDAAVDHGTYAEDSWQYRLTNRLERWACRKVDQVAVLCRGLKTELIERGVPSEKLTVVFNGVNLEDFQTRGPDLEYIKAWNLEGKQVIGFIGSFFRYEGLDLLVEALAHMITKRPNLALLLVGGERMETKLKEQIQRLGLGKDVIMPGRIPHERIPGVYALVDILVYPRYSIRLTELVTPLKPFEAMAMGKAVVASDVGGHREIIEHGKTGLLFAAGNISALSETLGLLLDEPALRDSLATRASNWVREHTWDSTTSVYRDIYARALEQ